MMIKTAILLFHIFISTLLFSQRKIDVGAYAGGSFYLGDINTSQLFYSIKPSGGVLGRLNFYHRYSFRGSITYGQLSANDKDFSNLYQQTRNHSFHTSLIDVAAQIEFNFLPYSVGDDKNKRSSYVLAGLAYCMLPNTSSPSQLVMPLGIGYKINMKNNWAFGIEWSFRKTFTDLIDGLGGKDYLADSYKQTAFANNKDWYSLCNFFLTYMIFSEEMKCAAYGAKKKH